MGQYGGVVMHDDELEISVDVATRLVATQFPEHAGLRVARVGTHGTVHAVFSVGDSVSARFPLRADDPSIVRAALEHEASSARELAGAVSVEVPEPLAIGAPGEGYPLPWSLHRWLPGPTATEDDPGHSVAFALDLVELVRQISAIPLQGRSFRGSGRGGDLRDHDWWMRVCFDRSTHLLPVDRLRATWAHLRPLPRRDPDRSTHGDLVPGIWWCTMTASSASSTSVGSVPPTRRSTSSSRGTSFTTSHALCSATGSPSTTSAGSGVWPGPSNRRWAWSGITRRATPR